MSNFDFKSYHLRAINAQSEEEKIQINQELKDLYASLNDEQKNEFNLQLENFLIKEYANIKSVTDGLQSGNNLN
ncbi:MAG: hypothetical protein U0V72_07355 [Cytophagales bacterium]